MCVHLVVKAMNIKFNLLGIVGQVFSVEPSLIAEEQVVHPPEFSLGCSRFRRFRRELGFWMDLSQRKMPEGNAQLRTVVCKHDL